METLLILSILLNYVTLLHHVLCLIRYRNGNNGVLPAPGYHYLCILNVYCGLVPIYLLFCIPFRLKYFNIYATLLGFWIGTAFGCTAMIFSYYDKQLAEEKND